MSNRESPHIIAWAEVDDWLADSVVKTVTHHRTSWSNARDILEQGVRLELASADAAWGQGFYSSTLDTPEYGEAVVRVAVKLTRPLVIRDTIAGAELLDELLLRAQTQDFRAAIVAAGYDGVIVHWGPKDQWVVAFSAEQVRIVKEQ